MPANSNFSSIRPYGTATANRAVPALLTRELFVNTNGIFYLVPGSPLIASGGTGFTPPASGQTTGGDVGNIGIVNVPGSTRTARIVIDSISPAGVITGATLFDPGIFASTSTIAGPVSVSGWVTPTSGVNFTVNVQFIATPVANNGSGIWIGDANTSNKTIKMTGSLAPQDFNNVNITGGVISNVQLANVTLVETPGGGNIFVDPTISNPTITNFNSPLPGSGVTQAGVLVLGSDGKIYSTNNVKINSLIVGNPASSTFVAGKIVATNDIVGFQS